MEPGRPSAILYRRVPSGIHGRSADLWEPVEHTEDTVGMVLDILIPIPKVCPGVERGQVVWLVVLCFPYQRADVSFPPMRPFTVSYDDC